MEKFTENDALLYFEQNCMSRDLHSKQAVLAMISFIQC